MKELKYLVKFGFYFIGVLFIASAIIGIIGLPLTFLLSSVATVWGMTSL